MMSIIFKFILKLNFIILESTAFGETINLFQKCSILLKNFIFDERMTQLTVSVLMNNKLI